MLTCFHSYSDEEIWREFQAGNEQALGYVFQKNYTLLYRYGQKFGQHPEQVKDLVQELFLTLWKNRATLGPVQSIQSYLLVSFRRLLLRSGKNQQKEAFLYDSIGQAEAVFHFQSDTFEGESSARVSEALNILPDQQREIIYLRFYNNLDFKEISEIMSLNYQTVRNYAHLGMQKLRKYLMILR
jgi:RNA polymerase sigma factor (sigma-70 family)